MMSKTAKNYGIALKTRKGPVKPVELDLSGEPGVRIVKTAAKRVIQRHKKVIKALADR
ncbi:MULTISPECIES: acetyltransferase [Chromobacterium]|uniref:Acetyltransferase n=2 Tax=Chromobacterium TaxID=535 RepID=A0ABX0LJJ8_9NEIS|nr:acetyltransferase [Chromobacterium haemolyticum]NHR08655.1 acetyltransferase [Chromobacterium haemolyticum]